MGKFNNQQIKIGVLRGGNSIDYNSSLLEGANLISYITENLYPKYKPIDIFVDKNNIWHIQGVESSPFDLKHKVDIIWNTASPEIHQIIKNFYIPNVGHSAFSFLIKKNKNLLRDHMKMIEVKVPNSILFPIYQEDIDGDFEEYIIKKAKEVHDKFSPPYLVKSYNDDLDQAIHVAKTFPELVSKMKEIASRGDSILVEELIGGQDVSLHLLKNFRNENIYKFPFIEKIKKEEKEKLYNLAKDIHEHVGGADYLKLDFCLHPNLGIYLKNLHFIPDVISDSHLIESIESVGAKKRHIFEHILNNVI